MKILLFLSALLFGAVGVFLFVVAVGGIHQATAASFLVASAVSFAGAGIVEALNRIEKKIDARPPAP